MNYKLVLLPILASSLLACQQTPAPDSSAATPPPKQVITTDGTPATAAMTRELEQPNPEQQAMLDKIAASLKEETVEAHFERGQLYLMAGEQGNISMAFPEAVKDFDWILEREPKHAGALSNRGMAHVRSGQIDPALADFKAASEVNPKDDYPLLVYASILAKTGKEQEAIAAYSQAIALEGKLATPARFNRGNAYLRSGDEAKAKADFEEVVKSSEDPQMIQGAKMNLEALKK